MATTAMVVLVIFCSAQSIAIASLPPQFVKKPIQKKIQTAPKPIKIKLSAYYRVLENQDEYVTGSYQGDIALNGTGITNSGKVARIGHLAADLRHYPKGTQIKLIIDGKDHGIWTVEDRGGAIKGEHRFDAVFGEGDAGRIKAHNWGMGEGHTVIGYVVKWGKRNRNTQG